MHFNAGLPTDALLLAAGATENTHSLVSFAWIMAAALLALGQDACRESAVSGQPRGGYCMMGVCFDCLVTIDDVGNRQGCLIPVEPGMQVEIQRGKREPGK